MLSSKIRKNPPRPRISDEDYQLLLECCAREGIRPGKFLSEAIKARAIGARKPTVRTRELAERREFRRRICLVLADLHGQVVESSLRLSRNAHQQFAGRDHAALRELLEENLDGIEELIRLYMDSEAGIEQ